MTKLYRIPLFVFLLLGLLCQTGCNVKKSSNEAEPTVAVQTAKVEETPETRAEKFLAETAAGNYEQAIALCDETMKEAMPVDMLKKIWTDLTTQFGKSTGIQTVKTEEVLEYIRVHAECRFDKGRAVLMVVVDKDLKISGLFLLSSEQDEKGKPTTVSSDSAESRQKAQEGWRNFMQGNFADAELLFIAATQLDPKNANAYQGLGWAQLNRGKMNEAKETFLQCMELDPRNTAALNGLGQIAQLEGDTEKAIVYWTEGATLDPRATGPIAGLAAVYDGRDDYENAIKYYEMWLRAEPNNDTAKAALQKVKEKASKQ